MRNVREPEVRIGQKLERGPPLAVAVEREAVVVRLGRGERNRARKSPDRVQCGHLVAMAALALRADAADRDAATGQPLVGIVGTEREPILGARREHAIGLGDAARDQIVDHHTEIALRAVEHDVAPLAGPRRRVEPGHQALRGSLFVTGGAVDLASEEKSADTARFQRGHQLAWIDVVVLDRVARADHPRFCQPRNARHQRELDVLGQRGGNPVGIDGRVVEPFGFKKNLVAVAFAEAHDLVLDRGAITRSAALDLAGIHGRAVDVRPDDAMGVLGGARDGALDLRVHDAVGQGRERLRWLVAGLHFELAPVDRGAVEARRRAGLEPPERKSEPLQRG